MADGIIAIALRGGLGAFGETNRINDLEFAEWKLRFVLNFLTITIN